MSKATNYGLCSYDLSLFYEWKTLNDDTQNNFICSLFVYLEVIMAIFTHKNKEKLEFSGLILSIKR